MCETNILQEGPAEFIIRAATEADISKIEPIRSYYAINTLRTMGTEALSIDSLLSTLREVYDSKLPYLVAEDRAGSTCLGFSYVQPFMSHRAAYCHTVELAVYCHQDHQGKGVGSKLLSKLIDAVRQPDQHLDLVPEPRPAETRVRHIIARMALDPSWRDDGWALARYYERFGFVQVGHFKAVGRKFDKWSVSSRRRRPTLICEQDRYGVLAADALVLKPRQMDGRGRTRLSPRI